MPPTDQAEKNIDFGYQPGQISPELRELLFSLLGLAEQNVISADVLTKFFFNTQAENFGQNRKGEDSTLLAEVFFALQLMLAEVEEVETLIPDVDPAALAGKWIYPGHRSDQLEGRTFYSLYKHLGELSPNGAHRISAVLLNKIPLKTLRHTGGISDPQLKRLKSVLGFLADPALLERAENQLSPDPTLFAGKRITDGEKPGQLPRKIFKKFSPEADHSRDYCYLSAQRLANMSIADLTRRRLSPEQIETIRTTLEYLLTNNIEEVPYDNRMPLGNPELLEGVRISQGNETGQLSKRIFGLLEKCGLVHAEFEGERAVERETYVLAAELATLTENELHEKLRQWRVLRHRQWLNGLITSKPKVAVPSFGSSSLKEIRDCLDYWDNFLGSKTKCTTQTGRIDRLRGAYETKT